MILPLSRKVLAAVGKLRRRVRSDGAWSTARRIVEHAHFLWGEWRDGALDRRYGTDTGRSRCGEPCGSEGENSQHSTGYEPTRIAFFRRIMRELRLDPSRYTFVDFGSGKGRALLLAAEHSFGRVVGIEFSPTLCQAARRNVALFNQRRGRETPIEVHCRDAVEFPLPEEDSVYFLYNPFDAVLLERVVGNMERSYRQRPRRIKVAYLNPAHAPLFDRASFLRPSVTRPEFRIYQTRECASSTGPGGQGQSGRPGVY